MNDNKIMASGFWLLMFLSPFICWPGLYDYANLPQSVFIQFGTLLVLVIFIVHIVDTKVFSICLLPIDLMVTGFLMWSVVSLFWAHNPFAGFMQWILLLSCILVYFAVQTLSCLELWLKRFSFGLVIAAGLICIIGCSQYYLDVRFIPQTIKPAATFGNKNMAAGYVAAILPLAAMLLFSTPNKLSKSIPVSSIVLALIYLKLVGSRTAMLAGAISTSLVFLFQILPRWQRKRTKRLLSLLIIFLAICVALISKSGIIGKDITWSLTHPVITSNKTLYDDSSSLRWDMWQNGLSMICAKPILGFGFGNFKTNYPAYHQSIVKDRLFGEHFRPQTLHNDFLQIGVELGLIGCCLFGIIIILVSLMSYKNGTNAKNKPLLRSMNIGFSSSLLSILILCVASFPLERAPQLLLFFFCLGAVSGLYRKDIKQIQAPSQISRIPVLLGMSIAGVILAAGLFYNLSYGIADKYYETALFEEHQHKWPQAAAACTIGLRYNPHHIDLQSALGLSQIQTHHYHDAIYTLENLLLSDPFHLNALINLSNAYYKAKNPIRAIETLKKALAIQPDSIKILGNLSKIYRQQKDFTQAAYYAKRIRQLSDH